MAHAVVAGGQVNQAEGGEAGEDLLTDGAVDDLASLIGAAEQEGQVEDLGGLIERGEAGGAGQDHIDGAHTGGLDGLSVVAEGAGVVHIEGDGAVGGLSNQLRKLHERVVGDTGAGAVGNQSNGSQLLIRGSEGSANTGQREDHDQRQEQGDQLFHVVPP